MKRDFEELCRIEPRLKTLLARVPLIMSEGEFWPRWIVVKRHMSAFVGWSAENGELTSSADYETAYAALFRHANECSLVTIGESGDGE